MRKSTWVVIAIIVLVLILGYLGRHKIKTLIAGSSATPQTVSVTPTETPMAQTSATPEASALNNDLVTTRTDPAKGAYLADTKGLTLYSYDKDTTGVSNCTGSCAKVWPPYTLKTKSATLPQDFTLIKRSDGTMQLAYKDKPLYYYATDTKPGDIAGDGVSGIWHLVKP